MFLIILNVSYTIFVIIMVTYDKQKNDYCEDMISVENIKKNSLYGTTQGVEKGWIKCEYLVYENHEEVKKSIVIPYRR